MALGEALTNLMWARATSLADIKASVNWMYAAKLGSEGADMYDAAVALKCGSAPTNKSLRPMMHFAMFSVAGNHPSRPMGEWAWLNTTETAFDMCTGDSLALQ